jgi:6-phosphogluconate dehydrogenase
MIKLKMNYREIECFYEYLRHCITDEVPKTNDKEKEYLIACHIQAIMKRLYKKMGDVFSEGFNSLKKHVFKLDLPEILSIYKYFNRYELSSFLIPVREQIYKAFQMNNNLLCIVNH